jgi:copper chaperone
MTTISYRVGGMTCGHCASSVTSELKGLDGVADVAVDLVANGVSTVTVSSDSPLSDEQIRAALDEAGNDTLA